MAWAQKGTIVGTGRKTTGTAVVTLTTGFTTGDVVVVWTAADPGTTGTGADGSCEVNTVSDSKGNTYTRARENRFNASGAATGIRNGIFYTKVTTALVSGDTVQVNVASSSPAKALRVIGFSVSAGNDATMHANTGSQAADSSGAIALANLDSQEYLFVACIGADQSVNSPVDADATWSDNGANGTSGGASSSNVNLRAGYKITTATGATYDWVNLQPVANSIIVAFREINTAAPTTAPPGHPTGSGITRLTSTSEASSLHPIFESQITG